MIWQKPCTAATTCGERQPVVDIPKVLVAPLVFVSVRGEVRVDETNGRVVKFEREGDSAFVTHRTHEARADGLLADVADELAERLLDVDAEHHADEADGTVADDAVLGARMKLLFNGIPPFRLRFRRRKTLLC